MMLQGFKPHLLSNYWKISKENLAGPLLCAAALRENQAVSSDLGLWLLNNPLLVKVSGCSQPRVEVDSD